MKKMMKATKNILMWKKTPLAQECTTEDQHQAKVHLYPPKTTTQKLPQQPHSDLTPLATSKLMTMTLMKARDPLQTGTASQVPHSQRSL